MAAFLPLIVGVAGSALQGKQQSDALNANAGFMQTEGTIAAAQGYQAEADQRRRAAMFIGAQTAAAGQSGTGYGGSNARVIGQSATNAEMDALAIRYKAQLQKWGYTTQAGNLRNEADTAFSAGIIRGVASGLQSYARMKAGAFTLTGNSGSYLSPGTNSLG